jgi:putative membrane protein
MLSLIINWVLSAVSLLLVAHIVPGFQVTGFGAALGAAVVIGLVNATIGLFLKIVTFPLTLITLGVFWFVINAFMLNLVAAFVPGFSIEGFLPAFLGAIVLSLLNLLIKGITRGLTQERPF